MGERFPDQREDRRIPEAARSEKRRYQPPRLVEYGHVGKLTQTGGGSIKDGTGNRMRTCL